MITEDEAAAIRRETIAEMEADAVEFSGRVELCGSDTCCAELPCRPCMERRIQKLTAANHMLRCSNARQSDRIAELLRETGGLT